MAANYKISIVLRGWMGRRLELLPRHFTNMSARVLFIFYTVLCACAQETSTQAPLTLTLQDAQARARANSVQFQSALTDQGLAHQDNVQARAALLPSVNYNTTYLYTQGNGTSAGRYVASNSVHEYLSQGAVHQEVGYAEIAGALRTPALGPAARATADIAARQLLS